MSAFNQASDSTEKARREALEAMARSGSAGIDAYKEAQSQVTGYRDAALSQALSAAAKRGASPAAQGALETTIRAPGDRTLQHLAAAQGTFAADMARRSSANDTYFQQAKAAVPAIQAASDRDVSYARARIEAQAAKEQKASEDAKWEQEAITRGLAEMQAEAERTKRFNDLQEQQAIVAGQVTNPTYDPIGAALGGAEGVVAPEQVQRILANPMAGATYRTPSGAVVPVTPGLADPHYMGHLLPDAAAAIAEEIAAARVPDDVAAQRQSYMDVYGSDPRTQALARGMFMPLDPLKAQAQELTALENAYKQQFFEEFGVLPTTTNIQRWQRGEDPFTSTQENRILEPEEAAQIAELSPQEVDSLRALPAFNAALIAFEKGKDAGASLAEVDRTLQEVLEEEYGRDYPKVRALVAAMFAGAYRG